MRVGVIGAGVMGTNHARVLGTSRALSHNHTNRDGERQQPD